MKIIKTDRLLTASQQKKSSISVSILGPYSEYLALHSIVILPESLDRLFVTGGRKSFTFSKFISNGTKKVNSEKCQFIELKKQFQSAKVCHFTNEKIQNENFCGKGHSKKLSRNHFKITSKIFDDYVLLWPLWKWV